MLVEERPLPDALKTLSLKDAMYISEKAWSAVKSETISKCCLKVLNDAILPADDEESTEILVQ